VTATYTITPADYMTNTIKRSMADEILNGTLLSRRDVAQLEYRDEGWWALVYDHTTGDHRWVAT
jgi:hypothetical protein